MTLLVFEDLLNDVKKEMDDMDFDQLLRRCREILGIRAYNLAEFMGITLSRFKSLERGTFCTLPDKHEIEMLEKLFDIPEKVWKSKAYCFLDEKVVQKRVRRKYGKL